MKLILVRHGETEWVRQGRYQGSTDVPLNRTGFRQARVLARLLKKERPLAVYSSELTRACETAKFIARACQKEVLIDKRLNEVSFGKWEGFSHRGIRVRFPRASRKWYLGRWTSRPPGGESLKSLEKRVTHFLKELLNDFSARKKGSLIVVTHGGPIRMFLVHILKTSPEVFWKMRVDPASLSIIWITKHKQELILLNGLAHLNGFERGGRKR